MYSSAYLGWFIQIKSCEDCVPPLRKPEALKQRIAA